MLGTLLIFLLSSTQDGME